MMLLATKIKLAVLAVSVIGLILLLWRLDHVTNELETKKTEITTLEQTNETLKTTVTKSVNRPRTDDDVTRRLCKWADAQYRAETGKTRKFPIRACDGIQY